MGTLVQRSFRPAMELLEDRTVPAADAVLQWNAVALDAIRAARTPPPMAARDLAIVQGAVYDAVNAITRTATPQFVAALALPGSSPEAAVAGAAFRTLSALFPAQQAMFDAALQTALAAIPAGPGETNGLALGQRVADQVLALRANDGAAATVNYVPGTAPGQWVPTPAAFAAALLPQWPQVTPFGMTSGSQFRPAAPPALTSQAYAAALNEVESLGSATSTTRTADQTAIALFWADGAGTATPPGHWNLIAGEISQQRGLTLAQNARLFAMLDCALADAGIVAWDAKFDYNFWRPVTAIRNADLDGNAATTADPTWTPLLATPPFPSYTSGHSTFSAAAAAVLADFFGRDNVAFTASSEDPNAGDRSFTSFSQAAQEAGLSRIYGGIHYSFDNVAGLQSGTALGHYVASHFFQPAALPAQAGLVDSTLVIQGTEGADHLQIVAQGNQIVVFNGFTRLGSFDRTAVTSIQVDARGGNNVVIVAGAITLDTTIMGGAGNDYFIGGGGNDHLLGGGGNNVLLGGAGNDTLEGGAGVNLLFGGLGNDTLIAGTGRNFLIDFWGTNVFQGGTVIGR